MPFEFLTDDHLGRYGQFDGDPTPQQLMDFFRLSGDDFKLVHPKMEPHTRLGMAIQLGTLRFLGTFLSDPTAVPKVVVRYVAEQLNIRDARILGKYLSRRRTRFEHAKAIRDHLGYKVFGPFEAFHLRRLLYARLLVADERPIKLFDECTRELVTRRVVLPGATTLARLVVEVRERVSQRLYRDLARRLSQAQRQRLGDLLIPPQGQRKTPFDQLRTPPSRVSATSLVAALERIEAIQAVGVGEEPIPLKEVPESRLSSLSGYAEAAWAQQLSKLGRERCHATLLAYMQHLERSATDDALDIFDSLMSSLNLKSQRRWRRERLRSLGDLDASALVLREAVAVLLDSAVADGEVRKTILTRIPEAALREAATQVATLASPDGEAEPQAWQNAAGVVVKFIQKLLTTLEFEATPSGKPLLAGMTWVVGDRREGSEGRAKSSDKKAPKLSEPPKDFVPRSWDVRWSHPLPNQIPIGTRSDNPVDTPAAELPPEKWTAELSASERMEAQWETNAVTMGYSS